MWHASLIEAIDGLDAEGARWSPAPERPSIWALVRHVAHWKRGVMAALDHDGVELDEWMAGDWSAVPDDDAAWAGDREELIRTTRLLAQRLAAADERLLDREMFGFSASIAETAMHVATHDAYHAGQVRLLRKLYGAD